MTSPARRHAPSLGAATPASNRAMIVFLALAFGLSWLVCLPLWIDDRHLASPWALPLTVLMMFTPAIAAFVAVRVIDRNRHVWWVLGFPIPAPWKRVLGFASIALLLPLVLVALGLVLGWAFGLYHPDLVNYSGFREVLNSQLAEQLKQVPSGPKTVEDMRLPIAAIAWIQVANAIVGGFMNLVPALGEEVGWRGLMFGWLRDRWGALGAIGLGGVIWGLWHAPLILLGYNYPNQPRWLGLLMMIGTCILLGIMLAWLRERSGTVLVPALAHGAVNAAAGLGIVFSAAGKPVDPAQVSLLGWVGWIPMIVLAGWIVVSGRLNRWLPRRWVMPSRLPEGVGPRPVEWIGLGRRKPAEPEGDLVRPDHTDQA